MALLDAPIVITAAVHRSLNLTDKVKHIATLHDAPSSYFSKPMSNQYKIKIRVKRDSTRPVRSLILAQVKGSSRYHYQQCFCYAQQYKIVKVLHRDKFQGPAGIFPTTGRYKITHLLLLISYHRLKGTTEERRPSPPRATIKRLLKNLINNY